MSPVRAQPSRFGDLDDARRRHDPELVEKICRSVFETDTAADRLVEAFAELPGGAMLLPGPASSGAGLLGGVMLLPGPAPLGAGLLGGMLTGTKTAVVSKVTACQHNTRMGEGVESGT